MEPKIKPGCLRPALLFMFNGTLILIELYIAMTWQYMYDNGSFDLSNGRLAILSMSSFMLGGFHVLINSLIANIKE